MDSDFLRLARRVKALEEAQAGTEAADETGGEKVTGPDSATTGHIAVFADSTGKMLKDSDGAVAGDLNVAGTLSENGNLVWNTGNDGAGSGLDADLLDGHDGTYYATAEDVGAFKFYNAPSDIGLAQGCGLADFCSAMGAPSIAVLNASSDIAAADLPTTGLCVCLIFKHSAYRISLLCVSADGSTTLDPFIWAANYRPNNGLNPWRAMTQNTIIRTGQCTLNTSSAVTVSFASGLPGAPRVVVTPNTSTSGVIAAKVRNVSASGFDAVIGGSGFSGIVFDYIAVYIA